jgi:orotate phosphoribosyltransferase
MTQEEVLEILTNTGALLHGHFELRSGLHSADFFQCANLLRFPRKAELLCSTLAQKIPADIADEAVTVISPALGGILVGHEVARALDKKCIFAEKQDGKLVLRRFIILPGELFIVAEDVVTRGGRVQETVDIVEQNGGRVLAIATLVDRSGGKADFGDIPHFTLLQMSPVTWTSEECPHCKRGSKAVHPGS